MNGRHLASGERKRKGSLNYLERGLVFPELSARRRGTRTIGGGFMSDVTQSRQELLTWENGSVCIYYKN